MERYPSIITAGALLGWIAGGMLVTDPAFANPDKWMWVPKLPQTDTCVMPQVLPVHCWFWSSASGWRRAVPLLLHLQNTAECRVQTPIHLLTTHHAHHQEKMMNTTIVYLDDADYAVQQISPLRGQAGGHWIHDGLCAAHDPPHQQMGKAIARGRTGAASGLKSSLARPPRGCRPMATP